jgi:hypothetical protein
MPLGMRNTTGGTGTTPQYDWVSHNGQYYTMTSNNWNGFTATDYRTFDNVAGTYPPSLNREESINFPVGIRLRELASIIGGNPMTYTIYGKKEDGSYEVLANLIATAVLNTTPISTNTVYFGLKIVRTGSGEGYGLHELQVTKWEAWERIN